MKRNDYIGKKPLGIYLHIPFCRSKCAYCDFYSFVPDGEACKAAYVDALVGQIAAAAPIGAGYLVDSVFIGGGTPTLLGTPALCMLADTLRESFDLAPDLEFTVEANPATVDRRGLRALRRAGVNRLSIGLQSAHENELRALSRTHTYADFLAAYEDARSAGIEAVNVDLMYGIPEQTFASLMQTLDTVTRLAPEHISLYGLKVEEGTPFFNRQPRLSLPDEDEECDMYLSAVRFLEKRDYAHYEISNYAHEGYRSRHNLKYWHDEEYLGFGCSAHSYFHGCRYAYVRDATRYIDCIRTGENPVEFSEQISDQDRIAEYMMLRWRLSEGIDPEAFFERFGVDFEERYGDKLQKYLQCGKMQRREGRYCLTTEGMYISNTVLSDVIDFDMPNEGN